MNGIAENRYSANWEKLSKRLKLLYDCWICGESEYSEKEVHHIDHNKKNGTIKNSIVLCKKHHKEVDKNSELIKDFKPYKISGYSVTVARDTSSTEEWFNSTQPLKLFPDFPSKQAMEFRKKHIKGWIVPGACNYYLGVGIGNDLFGILGFKNPDYGEYDLLLKADTTPPQWKRSTELLLYALKSKETQKLLSDKFNREVTNCYSLCFSNHEVISRYRKFGELINKTKVEGGYDLGYLFQLGIWSLKEAKARFIQKHEKN